MCNVVLLCNYSEFERHSMNKFVPFQISENGISAAKLIFFVLIILLMNKKAFEIQNFEITFYGY